MLDRSLITCITERPPLISIIIPVYKVEKYIQKCLDSLIEQTYENIEIILVDDGSPDTSGEICNNYAKKDARIKVLHKENGGLSDARNYGIEHSKGEYIAFVDSDDYVDKDYIEYLYSLIAKYGSKMSICQHRVIFDSGRVLEHGSDHCDELVTTEACLKRMLYHDVIDTSAWAKLYHRTLFFGVEFPKGKLFEDIGTTYKFMLKCEKIGIGYESKYNYIVRSDSIVNSKFNCKKLDLLEMTDAMARDVEEKYPTLKNATRRRCVYARLSTLNQMAYVEGYDDTIQELVNYVKQFGKDILRDKNSPTRDVIAVLLLNVSYPLYRRCWNIYRRVERKKFFT